MKSQDAAAPAPVFDRVSDQKTGILTDAWSRWFARLPETLGGIPSVLNRVTLSSQGASIGATSFAGATILKGNYRATYYARITTAAGVTSSLTVTLAWTDGAVAQTFSGAAMAGNTTTTWQSNTITIRADAGTAITYATTYASNPAGAMKYCLDLVLEKIRI